MRGLPRDLTLPQAVRGEAEEGLPCSKTPPNRVLNPFPPKSFPEASLRAAGAQRMGGRGSPRLFKATFLPPPSPCPPPLFQAVAPPSRGDVSPAPPPAGALWPNMANTAVLGSWDRLGGRGGGPWLGPLAAGEGEGSPGGGCKDESRRQVGPPSLLLAHRHMQDSLSRNTPVGRGTNTGAHR